MKDRAVIPGAYTKSEYPIQYYFEAKGNFYPGLPKDFGHAPYYVIRLG
jgi:hypothetical protein